MRYLVAFILSALLGCKQSVLWLCQTFWFHFQMTIEWTSRRRGLTVSSVIPFYTCLDACGGTVWIHLSLDFFKAAPARGRVCVAGTLHCKKTPCKTPLPIFFCFSSKHTFFVMLTFFLHFTGKIIKKTVKN